MSQPKVYCKRNTALNPVKIQNGCYQWGEGAECTFIRVDKISGLKLYTTKEEAQSAIRKQRKAHKHGIGPEAFGKVEPYWLTYRDGSINQEYGYLTEYAKPIGRKHRGIYNKKVNELENKMFKIGLRSYDIAHRNCGIIKGKLVCVDFGDLST